MEYNRLSQVNIGDNIGNRLFLKFLVKDVDIRKQRDGVTDYIVFNMADQDVTVEARIFGASQKQKEIVVNGKVCVAAVDVKEYAKSPCGYSCIIYNIDSCDEEGWQYIKWADNLNEATNFIVECANEITDTVYGPIVRNILINVWEKARCWSAARGIHHNVLGGLMTHTAEVLKSGLACAEFYNHWYGDDFLDEDLVSSAAILHDIGKVKEYDVDVTSGTTQYSDMASLESHVMSSISMVDITAKELNFGKQVYETIEGSMCETKTQEVMGLEREKVMLLKHCIASHHGRIEYGSPVTPAVPEAVLVNCMDGLSASLYRFDKNFKKMESSTSVTEWAGSDRMSTYKASYRV